MIDWKSKDPKGQILSIISKMGPKTREIDLYMILTNISHYISNYTDYNEADEQMADELNHITSEWEEELVYVDKEDLLDALNKAKEYLLKRDSFMENKKSVRLSERKLDRIISESINRVLKGFV